MSDYTHDEHLDDEQLAAVEASEEAISVLAGPGSGKTRTLAHRTRHLLLTRSGSQALLLTFTNKAAAEMKSRALGVGDISADRLEATTFHGFGAIFLRSHGDLVGIEAEFDILDEREQEEFAAGVARSTGLPNHADGWSRARVRRQEPGSAVAAYGEAYEAAKREEGLVDFDDLVLYTAEILTELSEIAAAYGSRYQHILIDEFQDTNPIQFAIVRALADHVQTISVFADDDQAIMRFAGAESRNVYSFTEQLGATTYPLTCNYRCREAIVECANNLIAADENASGRQMRAEKDGGEVEVRSFASFTEEAAELGAEIADLIDGRSAKPSEIAVLVKGGPRARDIADVLSQRGVPLTDWRGAAYETEERRMMITCFMCMRPSLRGRHATRLSELIGVELIEERDTHAFLEAHAGSPVAQELLALRGKAFEGCRPSELAACAHAAVCAADPTAEEGARELLEAVKDFERFDPAFSIDKLLSELALKRGGRPPTQGGGVKIATLHGTKGLQWPIVYMVGLEEGQLPFYLADREGTIPDERRACFVGVCRAEDRLILSYSRYFRNHRKDPSRFLAEMGLVA
jgi:ATP-dependent DNA helicase UvrD/PcrA